MEDFCPLNSHYQTMDRTQLGKSPFQAFNDYQVNSSRIQGYSLITKHQEPIIDFYNTCMHQIDSFTVALESLKSQIVSHSRNQIIEVECQSFRNAISEENVAFLKRFLIELQLISTERDLRHPISLNEMIDEARNQYSKATMNSSNKYKNNQSKRISSVKSKQKNSETEVTGNHEQYNLKKLSQKSSFLDIFPCVPLVLGMAKDLESRPFPQVLQFKPAMKRSSKSKQTIVRGFPKIVEVPVGFSMASDRDEPDSLLLQCTDSLYDLSLSMSEESQPSTQPPQSQDGQLKDDYMQVTFGKIDLLNFYDPRQQYLSCQVNTISDSNITIRLKAPSELRGYQAEVFSININSLVLKKIIGKTAWCIMCRRNCHSSSGLELHLDFSSQEMLRRFCGFLDARRDTPQSDNHRGYSMSKK